MNPIGKTFIELPTVESSNNYATGQVQAHLAGHGTTWFAHEQSKGKGQRGNTWTTEPGQNIILTVVIEPTSLRLSEQFLLSAAVALACYDLFSKYAASDTSIKWPNDLYWKDRKAGGILIENILQGAEWKYAVVGIGINVNQTSFPTNLPNPVSLKQITGKTFNPVDLAKELCHYLENRWRDLTNGLFETSLQEYNQRLYKLNEVGSFKKQNATVTAIIRGVNSKGELLLDTGREGELAIKFGDMEWLIEKI